jgi:hypothetical protein
LLILYSYGGVGEYVVVDFLGHEGADWIDEAQNHARSRMLKLSEFGGLSGA